MYHCDDGFIIQNSKMKDFAHSHLQSYKACLLLIDLSIKKKYPYNLSKYLIVSLIRINSDEKYLQKLNEVLDKKQSKKEVYYNINKGIKK